MSQSELDAFARFCTGVLTTEDGRPFELAEFQRAILHDYFDGRREIVVLLPKKNGKSSLVAALALWHLLSTPFAEAMIVAAARDQAGILLRQVEGFVRRSDELGKRLKIVLREVRNEALHGRLRVLASEVDTVDGQLPTFVAVDELHRHKRAELYGVLRDGLGPRKGQLIAISTAGYAQDSPLGALRQTAHGLPGLVRDGAYRHVRSGSFAFHEWSLSPEDDVDDLELVKTANPLVPMEELRERYESPSMTPWQWRRFACGIWTEGEEPWIEPSVWDSLADPTLELQPNEPAWVGVDIGVRKDTTALVVCVRRAEKVAVQARILKPPARGVLPLERVENEIRNLRGEFELRGVAYDPWAFRRSAEMLAGEGIRMIEFPQSPERMATASAHLYHTIQAGHLIHDGDPRLRAHVLAGVTKETERGWRLQKDPHSARPIDALIALAMGTLVAMGREEIAAAARVINLSEV